MKILGLACSVLFLQFSILCLPDHVLAEAALTLADCKKCHIVQVQQIAKEGMAHRDQVTCLDCHVGHPPPAVDNVPECDNCHGGTPHAVMVNCTACHQRKNNCRACHEVHRPLAGTSGEVARLHCKACHFEAVELMQASNSRHRQLECSFCHPVHRSIQGCSDCHGLPHSKGTHDLFRCVVCHNLAHDLNAGPSP